MSPIISGGLSDSLPALARNVGQVQFDFSQQVLRGASDPMVLAYSDGDASMVDLTTPTNPLIVAAGVYAFTLVVYEFVEGDQGYQVRLVVDDNYYSVTPIVASPFTLEYTFRAAAVTWWCNAADPFAARMAVAAAGATDPTFAGSVYVQRIR